MNSKADTLADLIYKAVQPAGTWTAFRTYLDLYADLRAMDREKEAADELFAEDCLADDEYTIVDVTPKPAKPEIPANKDETKKQETRTRLHWPRLCRKARDP